MVQKQRNLRSSTRNKKAFGTINMERWEEKLHKSDSKAHDRGDKDSCRGGK